MASFTDSRHAAYQSLLFDSPSFDKFITQNAITVHKALHDVICALIKLSSTLSVYIIEHCLMEDECSGRGNSPRRQNEITGFGSMCSIEDSCEDLSHRTLDFEPSRNRIGENISMDFFNDMMGMVVDITQD